MSYGTKHGLCPGLQMMLIRRPAEYKSDHPECCPKFPAGHHFISKPTVLSIPDES